MAYTPENNPYIPGDPYSYDLKWMVEKINALTDPLNSAERAEDAAEAAELSKNAATAEAIQAEAWAKGTKDGTPVTTDDPQYQNNSKYFSDKAAYLVANVENIQDDVNEALSNQDLNIAALVSRMDSFTTLAEGSTTGDAELIDARTGADGTIYKNAGTAIREQIDFAVKGYKDVQYPGGDVDIIIPVDFSVISNIFEISHDAITWTSATSLAIQYKVDPNDSWADILRKSGNQAAMTPTKFWVNPSATLIRMVLHSSTTSFAQIRFYKAENIRDYKKIFEWEAPSGYTSDMNYYKIIPLESGKTYHFAVIFGGFDITNNHHVAIQSGSLYRFNSFTFLEDILRYATLTSDRAKAQIQDKIIYVSHVASGDTNAIKFYLSHYQSGAYLKVYAKEVSNDLMNLDNQAEGLVKSIQAPYPITFRRTGSFGSSIGGIQALTILNGIMYTAHLGGGGTLAAWDSIDQPAIHNDLTSSKISHVISMCGMISGNLLIANGDSDDSRPVYELDPSDLSTVNTFNIPAHPPIGYDDTAVSMFVGEIDSDNILVIYANKDSVGDKPFYVFRYTISTDTLTYQTTFNWNVRYIQDGCIKGDTAYLMGNWGLIDNHTSANNSVAVYSIYRKQKIDECRLHNFLEGEGLDFTISDSKELRMYFGENSGGWLYSADI